MKDTPLTDVRRLRRRISVFDPEAAAVRLQSGDVLRVDCVGWFDHYLFDIARMAVVGSNPAFEAGCPRLYEGVHVPMLASPRAGQTASPAPASRRRWARFPGG